MRNSTKIYEIKNNVYGKFFEANKNLYSSFGAAGRLWSNDIGVELVSSEDIIWIEINYPYGGLTYEYKLSNIMADNYLTDESDLYDLTKACLRQATLVALDELYGSLY